MSFHDEKTAVAILSTTSPAEQKRLGKHIRGFKDDIWKSLREKEMMTALRLKFSQNKELQNKLIATETCTLVEASPTDMIWGVGLSLDNPDILHPEKWRGLNLLGKCLMTVRSEFQNVKK